ncbi:MAG: RNHCP domain-containing protein [Patescibacteria group bacterium]|nr:RNHCP domain-containing protein [Patescibacteria group bacterium]
MKPLPHKKFQKRPEDFVCDICGTSVHGDGYTDHCSNCLWSKHVDINPGDRKATCNGMMEPMSVEIKGRTKIIHYKCVKCGTTHNVKSHPDDNTEKIIELSQLPTSPQ